MIRLLFILTFTISCFAVADKRANACTSIKNDESRLSCYDHFFKPQALEESKVNKDQLLSDIKYQQQKIKVQKNIDRYAVSEEKLTSQNSLESNYGLKPNQKNKESKLQTFIVTSITKVSKLKNSKIKFTMANEQIWVADSSYRARNMFKPNTNIRIEQAALSGFKMVNIETNQNIRIKRIK